MLEDRQALLYPELQKRNQGTENLKKVGSHNNYEPEVKKFEFIQETKFLPVFLPVGMPLEPGIGHFILRLVATSSRLPLKIQVLL